MKKVLLISAFALAGFAAANAGATVERLWINNGVAGLAGSTRQGVGHDGKFYLLNSHYTTDGRGALEVWGPEGKLNEIQPDGGYLSGTNITIDDAGNIIGRAGAFPSNFHNTGNTGVFVYNAEADELTLFDLQDIKFNNGNDDVDVLLGGRNDFWGHVAGNVLSEEGGLLLYSTNANGGKFNEIKIVNGQHVVGGQQGLKNDYWWWAATDGEEKVADLYGTCGIISVYDWMPNEAALNVGADGNNKRDIHHMVYDKSGSVWVWKRDGKYYTPDRNVTTGFAFFKIGDETYIVYSRGSNNADAMVIVKARVNGEGYPVVEDPNSLIVYKGFAETDAAWNTIYNGTANTAVHFNVEVDKDGKSATIYQYVPKHFIAAYKFTPAEEDLSGISSINANEEAPVEYFNLQGMKVENPSNGVFIMRQGTKTTKVIR